MTCRVKLTGGVQVSLCEDDGAAAAGGRERRAPVGGLTADKRRVISVLLYHRHWPPVGRPAGTTAIRALTTRVHCGESQLPTDPPADDPYRRRPGFAADSFFSCTPRR